MKRIFTILPVFLFLFCTGAFAQGVFKFDGETHTFGKITEGTLATHEFKFKNTGNQPIVITHVQASCGCTTPDWSKDPIMPGKSGFVKAAFNSNGRPGAFNKTITVTSNASEGAKVLAFNGEVISKEEAAKNYTPEQKAKSAKIAIAQITHDFGKIEVNRPLTVKFKVKNTGKQDLQISDVKAACSCVALQYIPEPIKPNQEGIMELSYNPTMLEDRNEVVKINSNDIVTENPKVILKAKVVKSLETPSIVKEGNVSVPFK